MFEIDENNLPFVRTRQALLVLDLQNDFASPGGQLPIANPPNLINNILNLLPEFRTSGNVIWTRSIFEASRPVNGIDGEKVVTDEELKPSLEQARRPRPRPSETLLERHARIAEANGRGTEVAALVAADEAEDDSTEETFLTVPPGGTPRFVLPQSPATNILPAAATGYDSERDIIHQKSYYSAFKDGSLVQTLRSRFVTELYICGALSNISVFATAMDAAQYGYAITLVEDCLGYRSKARHDEALRRLTEFTGCDIMSSGDIIQDLKHKAKVAQRPAPAPRRPRPQPSKQRERKVREPDLESLMSKLNLRPDGSSVARSESPPAGPSIAAAAPANVAVAESTGSSESLSAELQELQIPTRPPRKAGDGADKPERVRTKIKTRRRSKSTANGGPAAAEKPPSPTKATLQAASLALEKMPGSSTEKNAPGTAEQPKSIAITKDSTAPTKSDSPKTDPTNGHAIKTPKQVTQPPEPEVKNSAPSEDQSAPICEGDTTIINNLLDNELAEGIFEKVRDEVRWQKMSHQGGDVPRLVAVQGEIGEDGSIPIYRHPADESPPLLPFSSTVSLIRAQAEKRLGHSLNHVLIQFYRDGTDYISEHSDKTLDIVPNTFIVNVSLGAQRTMIFRTKKQQSNDSTAEPDGQAPPRQATRAPLPHNSMCKVGLVTNMRWLHSIRQDKRLASEKSEAELAYNGARISLTFRQIGTFLSKDQQKIWGQGAISKSKNEANTVINGNTPEAEKMIRAFGKENRSSEFDWAESYGEGFDVLHMNNTPKLFLSGDKIADLRVRICLAEYGIEWAEGNLSPSFNWKDGGSSTDTPTVPEILPIRFVDNDLSKSTPTGDLAILLYLDSVYGSESKSQVDLARQFTRFQQVGDLLKKWRIEPFNIKHFKRELELWEAFAKEDAYIAGKEISLADWVLWPILDEIYGEWGLDEGLEALETYYKKIRERECVIKVLGKVEEAEKEEQKKQELKKGEQKKET